MKRRSLVLVTVDCLRADHLGFNGYSKPVSPFLDSLAQQSIAIPDAIVAGVPTYFSFPAIMASRYPLGLGRHILGIAPEEKTIATCLRDNGYRTAGLIAGNPYVGTRYGFGQGFQTFDDYLHVGSQGKAAEVSGGGQAVSALNRRLQKLTAMNTSAEAAYNELYFWYCQWKASRERRSLEDLRPYPSAATMVDRACSWLRENYRDDFFLWIHLMDAHHPHYPPQHALSAIGMPGTTVVRQRFLNSFWNRRDIRLSRLRRYVPEMIGLYDASIRWIDEQVARLTRTLQELDRWNDTVFVVTADHGEEFLEHGDRYHSPMSPIEQLIRVPLLMHIEGVEPLREQHCPFSLIHLAPTLLDAMGVGIPSAFTGRSFWDQIAAGKLDGEAAILETVGTGNDPCSREQQMRMRVLSVRDRDYKLVLRFGQNRCDLYDLKNDPEERAPLPNSVQAKERAHLLKVAQQHLKQSRLRKDKDLALNATIREIRLSLISA
ncbi:MAG TPA: sulfatase [Candidatus Sulfotelmatobacter sp.]|nr:sulfatase [Candidatus Sulfotelmatobacter sp.]